MSGVAPGGGTRRRRAYLASADELRAWFAAHARRGQRELWLGFHKRATRRPSPTWPEAVDEALCVGWIDGVRRRVDDARYVIRFTRRKARPAPGAPSTSPRRGARGGRPHAAGRARGVRGATRATAPRSTPTRTGPPSCRRSSRPASARSRHAWAFYQAQAPWYRRTTTYWVVSGKRAETRERRPSRLLIADSAAGRRLDRLSPGRRDAG